MMLLRWEIHCGEQFAVRQYRDQTILASWNPAEALQRPQTILVDRFFFLWGESPSIAAGWSFESAQERALAQLFQGLLWGLTLSEKKTK